MSGKVSLVKKDAPAAAAAPPPKAAATAMASATVQTGAQATPATGKPDGLTLIMARNSFYASNVQKMFKVFLGQFILIVAMGAVIFKLLDFTDSRDYFFPAQADNTLILERPLTEPVFSNEQIRSWVENAVTRTMTFGFYDHLLRLQQSRNYFTTDGWASFTSALDQAQIFERIGAVSSTTLRATQQVVVARLRSGDRANIVGAGVLGGRYTWKVELDIDITFTTRATQTRFSWKVDVTVTRLPTMESREGIGISQMVAEAAS